MAQRVGEAGQGEAGEDTLGEGERAARTRSSLSNSAALMLTNVAAPPTNLVFERVCRRCWAAPKSRCARAGRSDAVDVVPQEVVQGGEVLPRLVAVEEQKDGLAVQFALILREHPAAGGARGVRPVAGAGVVVVNLAVGVQGRTAGVGAPDGRAPL